MQFQIPNPGDNLTIGDLVKQYIKTHLKERNQGWTGIPFLLEEVPYSQVMNNIVDSLYQRLLSYAKLGSYKQTNLGLMIASVISRRPIELEEYAGDYVIDGQHKQVRYGVDCGDIHGTVNDEDAPKVTQQVLVHKYDPTLSKMENLKKILMLEAELYFALNTERKKLTKVDELRAEVICQDKDALHIQNVMQELNFQNDGFGARPILDENGDEDPNEAQPIEVTNFGQFYYVVMSDYSKDVFGLRDIKRGYRLYKKIYGNQKIHGTAFRAICFIDRYIEEALINGKATRFREWVVAKLKTNFGKPADLVKNYGSFDSPRFILYRVIEEYNRLEGNTVGRGAQTLGPMTLVDAVERTAGLFPKENRFKHPDVGVWAKIVDEVRKIKEGQKT